MIGTTTFRKERKTVGRNAKLYSFSGELKGVVDLEPKVFGIAPNRFVMHQVVVANLSALRRGTHCTKTRAEVSGGGAKPYRQKGTGRARQGSIRAQHFKGGGVAHGPKLRSYEQSTPKKMSRLALVSALSDRARAKRIKIIEQLSFDSPSAKLAKEILANIHLFGRTLIVLEEGNKNAYASFRNLEKVDLVTPNSITTLKVLLADWVVFTSDALRSLSERFNGK